MVRDLVAKLQRLPQDAHVVVSLDVIHDVEVVPGTITVGYYNPRFSFHAHGKDRALVFLANEELSTGEVVSARK